MDYLKFKQTNNYLKSIRKNSEILLVRVDSFDIRTNTCILDFKTQKASYPLNFVVKGVLDGLFCLSNPSVLSNIDFNNVSDYKKKSTIKLKDLKYRFSNSFYYKNNYINLSCISDSVITRQSLSKLTNDDKEFGDGLYCYYDNDIKKSRNISGQYISKFILKTSDLKVLDLRSFDASAWIALYLQNNSYLCDNIETELFIKKYSIDITEYDCIYGYIADELMASLISKFANGVSNDSNIRCILRDDCLDMKFVLISNKALNNLEFNGFIRNKYTSSFNDYMVKSDIKGRLIKDYIKEVI